MENDYLIYGQVAKVFVDFGLIEEAIEYHLKALKIMTETLGENHRETAASYNGLGNAYYSKGDVDRAIEYYEKALHIYMATVGLNHPYTELVQRSLDKAKSKKQSKQTCCNVQ